ncbi:CopD family protein [Mycobacterium sp. CPCC 205372]|uniref:CopD family protein n=1 Tax=Mycobacterium hippophais TaxID=3016340 RepID=A0ABT4PXN0_9MYCO|nr:CopD family protein [Mycobacterium hippophais]MCZ8381340.1 CopD family protein [Mycobacterium hippophais]
MGGAAPDVTAPAIAGGRAALTGALLVVAASALGWSLAQPMNSLAGSAVRALADSAAVVTLGLTVVPMLDVGRHRAELVRSSATALGVAAALWLLAEVVRLIAVTAQAAALPLSRVGARDVLQFSLQTTVGRAGLFSIAAALAVALIALAAPRTAVTAVAAGGLAAAGLAARTLAGHLAESPWGGVAVAVHALAAAVWCGALAAMVLTVGHRGRWARVLPRFSQLSLLCVGVLLAAGVAGAVAAVDSWDALFTTGYGRVLSAKIVVTAVLMVLAWRNRAGWLPAARAHRATAGLSRTRSLIELAIMAVALALAAALAVTG